MVRFESMPKTMFASGGSALKWLWITFVVVSIDQITKWFAEAQIDYKTTQIDLNGASREVISWSEYIPVMPHLNWTFAYNYGAAFSFLSSHGGWQRWFFSGLSLIVSIAILIWLFKLKDSEKWTAVGLSLVLGGAVGNLIDRALQGRVIDFIDVYADWDVFFLNNGHFATFNVADISINIGAFILVGISLFSKENS